MKRTATKLLSRRKLCEVLIEMGRLSPTFKPEQLSNEVYGRKACIYLEFAKDSEDRKAVETKLEDRGFRINRGYWPGGSVIEVQVSYFKGLHWDE